MLPPDTIPGPAHEKVAPSVDDEPFNAIEVTVQLRTFGSPASATGAELSRVTSTLSVDWHPLGPVTVRI